MYLIPGATGHIGSIVARDLLTKGKKVRVVSRHEDKMQDLIQSGAEALAGDISDPEFVNKACEGITAAFCMIPPNTLSKNIRKDQQIIAHNYSNAVKSNGVKHVILLSGVGAHIGEGCGIVDGLADLEISFLGLKDVNVLNLRAGFFMENLFFELNSIKSNGIIGSTLKGNIKFPVVATRDIAAIVGKRLLSLDFKGNIIEYILGPRDLNYNEIAQILGKAIDRPELRYVQLSKNDYRKGMIQSGHISESVADSFIQTDEAFESGWALSAHSRTRENSTPTTFEEFVKDIAYVYHHQSAA